MKTKLLLLFCLVSMNSKLVNAESVLTRCETSAQRAAKGVYRADVVGTIVSAQITSKSTGAAVDGVVSKTFQVLINSQGSDADSEHACSFTVTTEFYEGEPQTCHTKSVVVEHCAG